MQLASRATCEGLRLIDLDAEPFRKRPMNPSTVGPADIGAVRSLCAGLRQATKAMRERQVLGRLVPLIDALVALPDRIASRVPNELVSMNQPARRDRAHDHPGQKSVACGPGEVASRFPTSAPGVV